MMNTKMTNKVALETAIEVLKATGSHDEVVAKLEKMLAQVEKKNSGERKPTATQTENKGLKEAILDFMVVGERYTVTDVMKNCEAVAELSNQRVSALIRQLKDAGLVERVEEKRKAYFLKVEVEEEA